MINAQNAAALSGLYGFPVPDWKGLTAPEMVEAAARYDRIVQLANAHGLGVLFTITGPSPMWVTGTQKAGRDDVADTATDLGIARYLPSLREPTLSQRMDELMEDGADPRELWPDVVERNQRSVGEWLSDREGAL